LTIIDRYGKVPIDRRTSIGTRSDGQEVRCDRDRCSLNDRHVHERQDLRLLLLPGLQLRRLRVLRQLLRGELVLLLSLFNSRRPAAASRSALVQ